MRPSTIAGSSPAFGGPLAAEPVLAATGIVKAFPGVVALDGVDFSLRAGEVHALAGENGSGKSTLARIVTGAMRADAGLVRVEGKQAALNSPKRAIELGIAAVTQELTLMPELTIAENIVMGRWPRRRSLVDWQRMCEFARQALDQLDVRIDERRRVRDLSIELQQEIEIVRAIAFRPRILILDEATSSLSEAATERLLQKLGELQREGAAVVFISHRLRELYACCQRATILRDGRLVATVELPGTSERELVRMMVGREIADMFGKRRIGRGWTRLTVANLTTRDRTVRDASLEVLSGEIVGVAGLVGSGKSEFALALAGAYRADGTVAIDGRPVRLRSPRDAVGAGMVFIPEDRKAAAIFPSLSVRWNLSMAWLSELSRFGVLNTRHERARALRVADRFALRRQALERPIVHLSGGNQQKAVLGRRILSNPRVLIVAEPTRGIDVGAKSEIYTVLQELAAAGAAIVMVSSELPELLGLCDRIFVMFRGKIVADFDRAHATEEVIAHAAMGGAVVAA